MADLRFSKEAVANAQNVIIQYLQDAGYAGSLEDGTGISDAVIKPGALLFSLFMQQLAKSRAYLSLSEAKAQETLIGADEYDNAVDSILANWFVTRNGGKPCYGSVRLWFLKPVEYLHWQQGDVVGTVNGVTLEAAEETVLYANVFSSLINTSTNKTEYYADVPVRSSENTDAELSAGLVVNASVTDIYYLRATIPADFQTGVIRESSDNFIARTQQVITTRELITERAIDTVLREEFDDIYRVYVARHGSTEQLRDIIPFHGMLVHVGNKADIYICSPLTKATIDVTVDENGVVPVEASLPKNIHIAHLFSTQAILGERENQITYQDIPFSIAVADETTWGKAYSFPSVSVDLTGLSTRRVRLTWLYDSLIQLIHDFVYDDAHRVTCYDPMVKNMYPVVLRFNIEIIPVFPEQSTASYRNTIRATIEKGVRKSITGYIRQLAMQGTPWQESEMVAAIHNDVPEVKRVMLPVGCEACFFDPKQGSFVYAPVQNTFTLADFPQGFSRQITANTMQLYTDGDLIAYTGVAMTHEAV